MTAALNDALVDTDRQLVYVDTSDHRNIGSIGNVVISIPNGLWVKGVVTAVLSREAIHPNHAAVYTPRALLQLLAHHGFVVEEVVPCPVPYLPVAGARSVSHWAKRVLATADAAYGRALLPALPYTADALCVVACKESAHN
jgi:hypothetical protein